MKKGINKKALILPLFIVIILAINLVAVSAQDPPIDPEKWASKYVKEPVKNFFNKYVIPNYGELFDTQSYKTIWSILSIFGFLIFCSIVFEIVTAVSPMSTWINVMMGLFIILIFTFFGAFRHITGIFMVWITLITGAAGIFGMIMLGVLFAVGGWAIFTGSTKAHKWISKIKYNKALTKSTGKAMNKAKNISSLTTLADAVEGHK